MATEVTKDISFAGARITIGGYEVTEFMDDANPVQSQDVEVSGVGMNFKGTLLRYSRGNPFMLSITVISGGKDDIHFRNILKKGHITAGTAAYGGATITGTTSIISPQGQNYSFSDGFIVSGPASPTATGEGKIQGNTYTFAFAKIT